MIEGKDFVVAEYDVPEWAFCYIEYGDRGDLTDEEVAIVDKWLDDTFPKGFTWSVDWEDYNELDRFPAFGQRNPYALTHRGESPYLACKTYKCTFCKIL